MKNLSNNFINLLFNKRFAFFAGGPEGEVDWGTDEELQKDLSDLESAGSELATEKLAEADVEEAEKAAKAAAESSITEIEGGYREITEEGKKRIVITETDEITGDPRVKVVSEKIAEAELRGAPEAELAELNAEYDRVFAQVQTEYEKAHPTQVAAREINMPEFAEPKPDVMGALNRALSSGELNKEQTDLLKETRKIQRVVASYFENASNTEGLSSEDVATLTDIRGAIDTICELGQYENANKLIKYLDGKRATARNEEGKGNDAEYRDYLTSTARITRRWVENAKAA